MAFSTENSNLIAYDETEWFRDYDHALFNYPFSERKTILRKYHFDVTDTATKDYEYEYMYIKLYRSETCLEPNVFAQLEFLTDFFAFIKNIYTNIANSTETEPGKAEQTPEEVCGNQFFTKIKFSSKFETTRTISMTNIGTKSGQSYDFKNINSSDRVLLHFTIGQESFKLISNREAT